MPDDEAWRRGTTDGMDYDALVAALNEAAQGPYDVRQVASYAIQRLRAAAGSPSAPPAEPGDIAVVLDAAEGWASECDGWADDGAKRIRAAVDRIRAAAAVPAPPAGLTEHDLREAAGFVSDFAEGYAPLVALAKKLEAAAAAAAGSPSPTPPSDGAGTICGECGGMGKARNGQACITCKGAGLTAPCPLADFFLGHVDQPRFCPRCEGRGAIPAPSPAVVSPPLEAPQEGER